MLWTRMMIKPFYKKVKKKEWWLNLKNITYQLGNLLGKKNSRRPKFEYEPKTII